MSTDKRFHGRIGDEYDFIRQVIPHFDELQAQVGSAIARLKKPTPQILEIGCGDGITTSAILKARPDATVVALDHEPKMIAQAQKMLRVQLRAGRCQLELADALAFVSHLPSRSVDAVASAMTLHNLTSAYRRKLHRQIYRVLAPGGIFVNADKYAPQNDAERFAALDLALRRFFDVFLPLRKYGLLEEWVLHNVADQGPERAMKQKDATEELRRLGFARITLGRRRNMESVLVATKR